jgi:hypothetical protein
VTLVGFLLLASSVYAKFVPIISVEKAEDGSAYVLVNRERVVHLKTWNGDMSPLDRATITAQRLTDWVQKGLDPNAISVKASASDARVVIGDALVVIATSPEAKAHGLPPAKLAEKWVRDLRRASALPPLSASPTSLVVPLGESRTVTVKSLLDSPVMVEVSNPAVVAVEVRDGLLVVNGLATGEASVILRCGEYSVQIQVFVKKYAASKSVNVARAVVTGWNATASVVATAAVDAAKKAILLEPGASIISVSKPQVTTELAPRNTIRISIDVSAQGEGYLPAKITVPVEVENRLLPSVPTSWIMYSNDPERILKYQVLFSAQMPPPNEAARLLYHHQNNLKHRVGFVIDVVNPSSQPVSLHIIEGVAPPMVDTVVVGYRAGCDFLENLQKNIGWVVDLPPNSRQCIVSQTLDYLQTASGVFELRQLSGDPLIVRVIAKPEEQRRKEDLVGTAIPLSNTELSKISMSDHVYPQPAKQLSVTYTVGKQWQFLRIGKEHIRHAVKDKFLYGNYGVIYDIKAVLENPLDKPQEVELAFEATAGPASGVFIVDGNVVKLKYLRSLEEASICKVTVPAGKSRTISLRTMPLSGSAYPATIIIRPSNVVTTVRRDK